MHAEEDGKAQAPAAGAAADEPAAGTPEEPVAPGEAQPGDWVERAQNLGGPVDVSPVRARPVR